MWKLTLLLFRYIASPDKKLNVNYLGPASIEDIAKYVCLIYHAVIWLNYLIRVLRT